MRFAIALLLLIESACWGQGYLRQAPKANGPQYPRKLADGGTVQGYWSALSLRQAGGSDITDWPSLDQWATSMANTGNYPTYSLTGLNSRPAAVFNGSSQFLTAGDIARFRLAIPFTALVVAQPTGIGNFGAIQRAGASGVHQYRIGQTSSGYGYGYVALQSTAFTGTQSLAMYTGSPAVYVYVVTGPDATHFTTTKIYKNGLLWDTVTVSSTAYTPGAGQLNLGWGNATYPWYWPGSIGEAVLWSGAATASEAWDITRAAGYHYSIPIWNRALDPNKFTAPPNASTLPLVNADDENSFVQPDVVCFDVAWNGYTCWMAVTGYKGGAGSNEYTRIFASNDKFDTPVFISTVPRYAGGSTADPNIIFYDGKLHVTAMASGSGNFKIIHQESSDGTTWTAGDVLVDTGAVEAKYAPNVIHQLAKAGTNQEWALYYVAISITGSPVRVRYSPSFPNPGGWSDPIDLRINAISGNTTWVGSGSVNHVTISLEGDTYYGIAFQGNQNLFVMTSKDGLNWTLRRATPLLSVNSSPWCSAAIYKPAKMIPSGTNTWDFYYSGTDVLLSSNWRVARTTVTKGE